jgi:hypothetical protein
MRNGLKKLFRMCEHKWAVYKIGDEIPISKEQMYDAMQFTVKIMCKNCGKYDTIESEYFDEDALEDLRKFFLDI